jgi:AraC family transcriptional regulator of adaptative response/methylated-DNA-[protein]-cysteine methyltransferase
MISAAKRTVRQDSDDDRWSAVLKRDVSADGAFVFAVKTTGIYCRPSCPSRRPKRQNVEFFALNAEAEAACYRPCRRCKPGEMSIAQKNVAAVETACRLMQDRAYTLKLEDLAEAAGMSPFHFHRIFKQQTGMTPKQYAKTLQDSRVRQSLQSENSVTAAIYEAGFESPARFYERAVKLLGMSPGDYRDGGRGQTIWYSFAQTSLGLVLVAGTAKGICSIRFGDSEAALAAELQALFPKAHILRAGDEMAAIVAKTVAHIDRPEPSFALPLDIQGTAFQHKVWTALQDIPFATTATYSDIAEKIGKPSSTRAVANACGANPVAVAIPCHRVKRSDGGLGGYRWGIERKKELLKREGG